MHISAYLGWGCPPTELRLELTLLDRRGPTGIAMICVAACQVWQDNYSTFIEHGGGGCGGQTDTRWPHVPQ